MAGVLRYASGTSWNFSLRSSTNLSMNAGILVGKYSIAVRGEGVRKEHTVERKPLIPAVVILGVPSPETSPSLGFILFLYLGSSKAGCRLLSTWVSMYSTAALLRHLSDGIGLGCWYELLVALNKDRASQDFD